MKGTALSRKGSTHLNGIPDLLAEWEPHYGEPLCSWWVYVSDEPWADDFFIEGTVAVTTRVFLGHVLVGRVLVTTPRQLTWDEVKQWQLGLLIAPKEVQDAATL